jgi:hypothetical protein
MAERSATKKLMASPRCRRNRPAAAGSHIVSSDYAQEDPSSRRVKAGPVIHHCFMLLRDFNDVRVLPLVTGLG